MSPVQPTQVKRPWRSTVRTVFQAILALAVLAPFVVSGIYSSEADYPAVVVQVLATAAVITRLMALPQVEDFLRLFLPFLAAEPKPKYMPEFPETTPDEPLPGMESHPESGNRAPRWDSNLDR